VRQHAGLYATHLRNEGDTLVESVEEALKVAKGAGVPLQLSHHKAEGDHNWGKTEVTLKMVEEARAAGLDVQMDQYPYNAFMTALSVQTLPWYAQSGTPEEVAARLNDPVERQRITNDMLTAHPDWADTGTNSHWRRIQIGVCRGRPEMQGKTVLELASHSGKSPIDWVIDLLVETAGYVSAVNFAMGPADIERVLKYPFTSVGSDGVGARPDGTSGKDLVHPRAYGTFPRVFAEYVRKQGILTETEAVRRMTSLPAARMGIVDRGVIRQGAYADLVVYDPATIGDTATFDAPHQYAHGINMVVVNGSIALNDTKFNDSLTGRVLRHSATV
jgi:N-acyl-D-aspartate/D-glutamate deacylase